MTLSPFMRAVGAGALAAAIGLIMWYGLVQITGAQLNFVAAGVGWAIGLAVAKKAAGQGSIELKLLSGLLALVTILAGSYLTLNHLFILNVPTFRGWLSVEQFFILYQAQFRGGRGVIDFVSALIGIYEAVMTPPGEIVQEEKS